MIGAAVDYLTEALVAVVRRPARAVLTALGTVLGTGALVATLGLATTAQAQISGRFDALRATQVTISDDAKVVTAPANQVVAAERRLTGLNGVEAVGLAESARDPLPVSTLPSGVAAAVPPQQVPVLGVTPDLLAAVGATVMDGRPLRPYDDLAALRIALVGRAVAQILDLAPVDRQPVIYLSGVEFRVGGIIADPGTKADLLLSIVVPRSTAHTLPGFRVSGAEWTVHTRLGAARQVGDEAPTALRPDAPDSVVAVVPPDPLTLRGGVESDVRNLYLLLAGLTLVVGAFGISNSALVSVVERTGEIGLRRALGASRLGIVIQFLVESAVLGLLGGLVGAAVAVDVVVAISAGKHWTTVLEPATALLAPLVAAAVGLIAGAYPAYRAARVLPVEALRRD